MDERFWARDTPKLDPDAITSRLTPTVPARLVF